MKTKRAIEIRLTLLLVAIWGVLILFHLANLFFDWNLGNVPERWFWLSGGFSSKLLLSPWKLVTYSLLHWDLWHLLVNLFFLILSAKAFRALYPSRRVFVSFYLLSALVAASVYLIGFELIQRFFIFLTPLPLMGASACILSFFVAVLCHNPKTRILLWDRQISLWLITLIYILLLVVPSWWIGNLGGHLAHLGGVLWGIIWEIRSRWIQKKHPIVEEPKELHDKLHRQIRQSGYSSLSTSEKQTLKDHYHRHS